MDEDGDDRSIKTRLFGDEHSDGVLKQLIKARLLRDLGQPTGGEDTDEQSGLGTEPGHAGLSTAPLRIGRFAILRKLGQGGMGVVYVAFDEQLDRKVAIKLLRRELTDDERGRARMLREAQALARLSNPNVVQVHEVGCWRDHDYVAMEFIAGQTLDHWLHEGPAKRPRPWREGLALLIQAGRGLAAAHARDLVHRDFKPANVMVGEDGRVRVLDFGLARSVHERGGDPRLPTADVEETLEQTGVQASETWNPTASSAFDRELTLTGAVLGTPAYMAPEQHLGQSATVLSDQFSFCVVLYEALFGERPFAAKSRADYTHRVIEGRIEVPGPKSGVPVWLRKAVLRGLAPNPVDRWPSMDALLTELSRERGRVWRVSALAAGFAAVLATGLLLGPSEVEMCSIDDAALAGVWDDARRTDVRNAFAASGLAHGDRTLERVMERLDEQADQLIAARGDACRARWVTQEQTDAQLELRNACLDQRRRELDATVDTLAEGDPETLEHGVELLDGLGDVGLCEQVDLLERGWLVAKDAKTAEQVGVLREQIAHAHALRLASDVIGARRILDAISSEAEAIDYGPLSAELLYLRGRLEQREEKFAEARESLLAAATMAEQVQHVELAPNAWIHLLTVSGGRVVDEDPERSVEYSMAKGAMRRLLANPSDLRWHQLATALSHRLIAADRSARAVEVLDESLTALDRQSGHAAAVEKASNLHVRAVALETLAQADAAEESYRSSWELTVELQGATALRTADIDMDLGLLLLGRESGMIEGIDRIERARTTYVRVYSPTSSRVAMVDLALANHALLTGDADRAAKLAERALQALPIGHPDRSWALDALAVIHMNRGDLAAAELVIEEAIQTHLDEGGAGHTALAFMRVQRGYLRIEQRRFADALAEFEVASEIYAASLSDQHPDWIPVHGGVGEARLGLGDAPAAWQAFERAQQLLDEADSDQQMRAQVAWGCARTLRALGRDAEGRRWAQTARTSLVELGSKNSILDEIEAFLE
jgi:tRNA A-37 threonylcarbamoyl transferase component Bud32/tetratricopeptide (TPR) repeat protein